MDWLEITIKTTSDGIEPLGEMLTDIGYDSFIIDDSRDFQSFLDDNTQYWDYVDESLAAKMADISQIRLYIEAGKDAAGQLEALRLALDGFRSSCPVDPGSLALTTETMQDQDWENGYKAYYQPIPIGEKLLIIPEWLSPENPEKRLPVILDPGMIFGTGSHASTQMCLRALEKTIRGGESVIDLGSGSGILSIAALRLGAKSAVGVDIDPKAEDIARENALLNKMEAPEFRAITGNVIGDAAMPKKLGRADVLLANIVADVIIPLSKVVPQMLADGGTFICSGILNTRLPEVAEAIRQNGLEIISQAEQNDWVSLVCRRAGEENL